MEQERPPEEEQPGSGEPPSSEDSVGEQPTVPEGAPEEPPAAVEGAPAPAPQPEPEPIPSQAPVRGVWMRQNLIAAAVAASLVVFGLLMFAAGFVVGAFVDDDESVVVVPAGPTEAQAQTGGGTQAPDGAFAQAEVPDVDDDPARGPEDAPVVIIEFSDFQCPFCGRFYRETLPLIAENYGDQIRFVYRDFPLERIHPFAQKAAEAAQCAHAQDAFWAYHDLLFENQNALDDTSLRQYAEQVGLDAGGFADCLDSGRYAGEVQGDLRDGIAAGVQGTPTFFINGKRVRGAQPYEVFEAAIEEALAQSEQ